MMRACLVLALSLFLALPSFAEAPAKKKVPVDKVPVKITQAWARTTAPGASTGAVYMKVEAAAPLKLLRAESEAAKSTELHEMKMVDGVMQMRQIVPIELVPGKAAEFKPGGLHVMLIELKKPIRAGDLVPVVLTFAGADNKLFTTTVVAVGGEKAPAGK